MSLPKSSNAPDVSDFTVTSINTSSTLTIMSTAGILFCRFVCGS